MDWIQNLLFNDASVAHTVILYAFVIALGVALGKMKFFGIRRDFAHTGIDRIK